MSIFSNILECIQLRRCAGGTSARRLPFASGCEAHLLSLAPLFLISLFLHAVQLIVRACASPPSPVAFALAASLTTASVHDCLLSYAFGWAENMTQAAVKAVPLGQSSGQRMLAMLAREIPAAVAHALHVPDHARQAFSPMLAILSSRHESQYSRLFRS